MNFKFLSLLSIFIVIVNSCKQSENEEQHIDTSENTSEITESDISKLKYTEFLLDHQAEEAILSWNEYTQINDVVTNVKKGDLSFFNDNDEAITALLKDFNKNIPEKVNTDAVKARITAFETKLYKLQSFSGLSTTNRDELLATIKEFLVAFSNLNLQMNKKMEADKNVFERP
ncbi:hypothetical protein RBH94_06870 [Aestuariibaculum sp. YM273]|uniref:hypothetical protein n=1 Tax=Aestuariibaculum sp. YM273 TaxID=3070659 RepID=UPI0027DC0009|nr:hypothetical protein [Aestuariibaculum sp. YM273]WMI66874.1 hypothetical protein RBH94_06870 [Aestuariibaculum sp. YM273]